MSDEASGSALPGKEGRVSSHTGWSDLKKGDWQVERRHARRGLRCILARLVALASAVLWIVDGHAAPALPGEPCQVDPRETWSETEKWVWNQVCIGEIANLNEHFDSSRPWLDPRSPDGWTEEHKLSSGFLETILLHDPWRSAIPRRGVRIIGAWFEEPLDLVEAEIAYELWLEKTRLTSDVNLRRIRTKSLVSLDGSAVTGTLNMDSASIGGPLFMRQGAEFTQVMLQSAKIGGQLGMTGSKLTGMLNMDSVSIGGHLFMNDAEFTDVDLRSAKIEGQLALIGAKVTGWLDMDSASIGGPLFMREGAEFADVNLNGAKIASQLSLVGARVTGTLDMESTSVGGHLLMHEGAEFAEVNLLGAQIAGQLSLIGAKVIGRLTMHVASIGGDLLLRDAQFSEPIELFFTKIGGNMDLRGATLIGLHLSGARLEGELHLASPSWLPIWSDGASLAMRNTRVGAVQDEPRAWPQEIFLDGFAYERLGGFGTDPEAAVGVRGSRWFVDWLARNEQYSPQPYEQLAKVLREMGHPEMATDVLYAGRERERREAWQHGENLRWLGLSMLNWTIGYGHGHRFFWALYWVIGLTLIGTVVLGVTGQNQRDDGKRIGIWYSLDMLLPIIQLRKTHYDIDLECFARYWFYGHKLMGYVLASFLIAGLAGLTR
jgi:uncharacterized protein YjbI with pentapeptide repeats